MRLKDKFASGIEWPTALWLGFVHLVALLVAPFFFSWWGLLVCVVLYFLIGCLGIDIGFHRLLTHGSFKTSRQVKWLFAIVGNLAGQGVQRVWVRVHKLHHRFSDKRGDPHSPTDLKGLVGLLWAHMLWLLKKIEQDEMKGSESYRDPVLRFLDNSLVFVASHVFFGILLYLTGWLIWDAYMALSLLLWGLFLRMFVVFHATWAVNSFSHMFGYRNYDTPDNSRNNILVALLTFGEGWHNNHHYKQSAANHGHRPWEIDVAYWVIRGLRLTRVAWDVRVWDYRRKVMTIV